MTMNSSGPISLAGTTAGVSIEIENGGNGTTTISLNDAAVRTLARVASGVISMPTDFYGKSNLFSFTISSNQTNLNLRALAVSSGWDQSTAVAATINSGVFVYSTSTGTPALTVDGSWPNGVTLNNAGTIQGQGGGGGSGGSAGSNVGNGGSPGGLALSVSSAVSINNTGRIAGGGGGGGGGGGIYRDQAPKYGGPFSIGGGGGGGGLGGTGGSGAGGGGASNGPGGSGNPGTQTSNGGGGGAGSGAYGSAGAGGAGGSYGAGGSSGGPCPGGAPGGGGGSAGGAVVGNSNITWIATGTRNGGIS